MRPRVFLIALLTLAACSTNPAGRWIGRVGDPCPGTALLSVGHGQAVFVRDDNSQVLRGTVSPDGKISARLETPGADKKGFVQSFTGQIQGKDATGTYASPRCAAAPATMHEG